ncbi:hypothetical protein B0T22DRAFT_463152 [Podospora appendiculata]|uniref:Uncharacterized protein n=1 Tax=Podospora appendiculata TaxID=314037 RepID=A0AAE1CE36_9PEZI|nr:hypothetical protein B0T22DRAFT_463152 [Podospora appendiculata]
MTSPNFVANEPPAPRLRRYPKAAILGIVYLALLIAPWALTAVINSRPFFFWKGPSRIWVDAPDIWDYRYLRQLLKGLQVAEAVGAVVSLPIVAALLARCAVVYSLRRRASNKLSARQLFALADGTWSYGFRDSAASTKLSVFGAVILAATFLFPALRSGLQSTEDILLPAHEISAKYSPPGSKGSLIGEDPGVLSLSILPQDSVVGVVKDGMIALRIDDVQQASTGGGNPYVWRTRRDQFAPDYAQLDSEFDDFYTTVAPQTLSTGLLRSHAIRMASSISCEQSYSDGSRKPPKVCPGERPFVASFQGSNITLSICVPGRWGLSPWEATTDKQTISEEMYIVADNTVGHQPGRYTNMIYCSSNSARGYFELPNDHNNGVAGHMLDKVPSESSVGEWSSDHFPPTPSSVAEAIENIWPYSGSQPLLASGTLMMAAMALFGNDTWFDAASLAVNTTDFITANTTLRALCEQDALPFRRFKPTENLRFACAQTRFDYSPLEDMVADFFAAISKAAAPMMSAAIFLVEEAMLKEGMKSPVSWNRRIYSMARLKDPVFKPTLSDSAVVGLSVLLGIQAVGIVLMLLYIYSQATWTEKLDALAIARIAHQLDDKGAIAAMGLRELGSLERDPLSKIDGLIGVVEQSPSTMELQSMPSRSQRNSHQNAAHTGEGDGSLGSQDSLTRPIAVAGNAEPVTMYPHRLMTAEERTATLPTYEEHQSQVVPPPYRLAGPRPVVMAEIPGLTLRVGANGLMKNRGKKSALSV